MDLNDFEIPNYSVDREQDGGIPEPAHAFYAKIGSAVAILVPFAEYQGFVTAAQKNIFDWMSPIEAKLWRGKPVTFLAASPGRRAGQNVLDSQKLLAPHFGADLRGTFGIGKWPEAWDPDGKRLVQADNAAALGDVLKRLSPQNAEAVGPNL